MLFRERQQSLKEAIKIDLAGCIERETPIMSTRLGNTFQKNKPNTTSASFATSCQVYAVKGHQHRDTFCHGVGFENRRTTLSELIGVKLIKFRSLSGAIITIWQ